MHYTRFSEKKETLKKKAGYFSDLITRTRRMQDVSAYLKW
jgi:hypothetical protein